MGANALTPRSAIFSLKSRFAREVYAEEKKFEFRRARVRLPPELRCFIYETAPVSAITGYFVSGETTVGTADDIAELEARPGKRSEILLYLASARVASAVEIRRPTELAAPLSLAVAGISRAPQSYMFLPYDLEEKWDTSRF